jgi:hypothetical protein
MGFSVKAEDRVVIGEIFWHEQTLMKMSPIAATQGMAGISVLLLAKRGLSVEGFSQCT